MTKPNPVAASQFPFATTRVSAKRFAFTETIRLIKEIDEVIDIHGDWTVRSERQKINHQRLQLA
jgi:hypothetical protein